MTKKPTVQPSTIGIALERLAHAKQAVARASPHARSEAIRQMAILAGVLIDNGAIVHDGKLRTQDDNVIVHKVCETAYAHGLHRELGEEACMSLITAGLELGMGRTHTGGPPLRTGVAAALGTDIRRNGARQ